MIFDLDGTLVDTAYLHAIAWQSALASVDIDVPAYVIHRRVGMNGDLLLATLSAIVPFDLNQSLIESLKRNHAREYGALSANVQLLPGATEIAPQLGEREVRWAIVTSAEKGEAQRLLNKAGVPKDIPVVTGDDISASKPSPEPLKLASEKLGVTSDRCFMVGDSVWDILAARRLGGFGIGLLTGGYGENELVGAGALRVYRDLAQLLRCIDEFAP